MADDRQGNTPGMDGNTTAQPAGAGAPQAESSPTNAEARQHMQAEIDVNACQDEARHEGPQQKLGHCSDFSACDSRRTCSSNLTRGAGAQGAGAPGKP